MGGGKKKYEGEMCEVVALGKSGEGSRLIKSMSQKHSLSGSCFQMLTYSLCTSLLITKWRDKDKVLLRLRPPERDSVVGKHSNIFELGKHKLCLCRMVERTQEMKTSTFKEKCVNAWQRGTLPLLSWLLGHLFGSSPRFFFHLLREESICWT